LQAQWTLKNHCGLLIQAGWANDNSGSSPSLSGAIRIAPSPVA
jgi:hypothetical protein